MSSNTRNLSAEKPHTYETSALGAAIDAAMGLKAFPDFSSAVKSMTRVSEVFEPDQKNSEIYRDLFDKVYMKMYKKMQPLYEDIREITNYPPFYSRKR